jgi:hypothetical protein
MKNIFQMLVLAALLIPINAAVAQSDDDKKFYKGVRAGYQDSNFSNSDLGDLSSFYVGFFGVKKLGAGKLLSMYSGLEYFQNGTSDNSDNQIIVGYISVPINLRVQIGPLYAFGGFNPSFKVFEDATFGGVDASDLIDVNGFDIGGQIGLGVKFLFLGLEIKYNQGLTNVFTDSGEEDNTSHHYQAGICVYF